MNMNSKINSVDYNLIASRFISDEKLSLTIQQNISFVEKYIDVVGDTFKEDIERQIVYRELGSVVYSAIEAVLKSVLLEINKRCEKRNCKESKCPYRRCNTISKINKAHTIDVLMYLLNVRLFGLIPEQIDEIKKLNDLRNYVHISKSIDGSDKSASFNKEYVIGMLDYYYEILDQLDLCDFYFKDNNACLKITDDDGFDLTEKQIQSESKSFYLLKAFHIIHKLFSNEELSENDKWVLKMLNDDRNINIEELTIFINKEAIYSRRYCKNEKEFNNLKEFVMNTLSLIVKNKSFIEKLAKGMDGII